MRSQREMKTAYKMGFRDEADIAASLRACIGIGSTDGRYPQYVPSADLILSAAQAIEARRAATTGAVEDESAVPTGCAQKGDDHD